MHAAETVGSPVDVQSAKKVFFEHLGYVVLAQVNEMELATRDGAYVQCAERHRVGGFDE